MTGARQSSVTGELVGMGWTSPEVTTATWDGLWAALVEKARNPAKFKMDVSDVVLVDTRLLGTFDDHQSHRQAGAGHIYDSECKGEMIFPLVDPQTKRETEDERGRIKDPRCAWSSSIVTSQMAS